MQPLIGWTAQDGLQLFAGGTGMRRRLMCDEGSLVAPDLDQGEMVRPLGLLQHLEGDAARVLAAFGRKLPRPGGEREGPIA